MYNFESYKNKKYIYNLLHGGVAPLKAFRKLKAK